MEPDKLIKKLEDDAIIVEALYKDTLVGFLITERYINPNSELAREIPSDELSSSIRDSTRFPTFCFNWIVAFEFEESTIIFDVDNATYELSLFS